MNSRKVGRKRKLRKKSRKRRNTGGGVQELGDKWYELAEELASIEQAYKLGQGGITLDDIEATKKKLLEAGKKWNKAQYESGEISIGEYEKRLGARVGGGVRGGGKSRKRRKRRKRRKTRGGGVDEAKRKRVITKKLDDYEYYDGDQLVLPSYLVDSLILEADPNKEIETPIFKKVLQLYMESPVRKELLQKKIDAAAKLEYDQTFGDTSFTPPTRTAAF